MESTANKKWWILGTMCILTIMLNIDATAVNLAVPVIAHELNATLASMQWVINAYVLVTAMVTILGGRFGDLWGHRRIFVCGTIIFVASSTVAGFAHSDQLLIAARAAQGFGLGIAYPMTLAIIYNVFPKNQYGLAIGIVIGVMGASLAIGPTIGGLIVHFVGWRWIFWVNIPIGIFTVILTYLVCPADKRATEKQKIDYLGALLLILGLLGFILALNQSQNWGVTSHLFFGVLTGGILALILLYFIEKKVPQPIVNFSLFSIRNFSTNSFGRLVAQLVFIPPLFFIPIYLQNIVGFDASISGLTMMFLTILIGVFSPIAGRWTDRKGANAPNVVSMILFAVSCLVFLKLQASINYYVLIIALLLNGVATGISFVSTTSGAMEYVPQKQAGEASGIFFTVAWAAVAIGVAFFGAILAICSENYLLAQISSNHIELSPDKLDLLVRASRGMMDVASLNQYQLDSFVELTKSAFMHGFRVAMLALFFVAVAGLIVSLFAKKNTHQQGVVHAI